ncbi:hypothetical protein A0H81_09507 [Grifola frondosa]|uniref:Uncharacterized protein n=1 Tax=Grifola frondosa TaxID=5627 RepID=A0A1C7M1C0_GRIFR|nr:hypothetical protein A0H81_09507 [Grifola frondosa]
MCLDAGFDAHPRRTAFGAPSAGGFQRCALGGRLSIRAVQLSASVSAGSVNRGGSVNRVRGSSAGLGAGSGRRQQRQDKSTSKATAWERQPRKRVDSAPPGMHELYGFGQSQTRLCRNTRAHS